MSGSEGPSAGPSDVVVVSADALVAAALSTVLAADPALRVTTGRSLAAITAGPARRGAPVVVYDLAPLVPLDEAAVAAITSAASVVPLVAVVPTDPFEHVPALLQAGVRALVGRDADPEELTRAVAEVAQGHVYASHRVLRRLVDHVARCPVRGGSARLRDLEVLAPRERDIVRLLTRGMTNREIAGALHLSEATVKAHLGRVMIKWQVRDRLQVALHALGRAPEPA